jgi:hypothetical protein
MTRPNHAILALFLWSLLANWFLSWFLNDATLFLHHCDYLLFEEELALYLNKLKFPLPTIDLYQVWLKFTCRFWRRTATSYDSNFAFLFYGVIYHIHLLMVRISLSWFGMQEHVLRKRNFQSEANYWQKRWSCRVIMNLV